MFGYICIAILMYAVGISIGFYLDARDWNKGRCPCGKGVWQSYDMDSQGGVMYKCSHGCGRRIEQSWGELRWNRDSESNTSCL